ncbi:MAG: peptidoglycan-binding domain-containing protein [Nitrospinae bacterium]|nr:peptidoglycan-binding domain-containing protein [Nitrospinota bacterium]
MRLSEIKSPGFRSHARLRRAAAAAAFLFFVSAPAFGPAPAGAQDPWADNAAPAQADSNEDFGGYADALKALDGREAAREKKRPLQAAGPGRVTKPLQPAASVAQTAKQGQIRGWRSLEVPEAFAAKCMQVRRTKRGGFNPSNVEIGNLCAYPVKATGICKGEESLLMAYSPFSGVYISPASIGDVSAPPGKFRPAPTIENCFRRDKGYRIIACRAPHEPYFVSKRIGALGKLRYMCFHDTEGEFIYDNAQVKRVQSALARAGFDPGSADRHLGPLTRSAIRRWQRANGHPATGEFTDAQLASLMGVDAGQVTRYPEARELAKAQPPRETKCAWEKAPSSSFYTWDGQKYVQRIKLGQNDEYIREFYGECKNGKFMVDRPYKNIFRVSQLSPYGRRKNLLKGSDGKLYQRISIAIRTKSGEELKTNHTIRESLYGYIPRVETTCDEYVELANARSRKSGTYVAVLSDKLQHGGKNRQCILYAIQFELNGKNRSDLIKKDMVLPFVRVSD